MTLRFLVVEGNTAAAREVYRRMRGRTASEGYAEALQAVAPDAVCDICFPADSDAAPPAGLADYDAVFITGSALNLYDGGPEIARQVALAKAVYAAQTPFFRLLLGLAGRLRGGGRAGGEKPARPRDRGRPCDFADGGGAGSSVARRPAVGI